MDFWGLQFSWNIVGWEGRNSVVFFALPVKPTLAITQAWKFVTEDHLLLLPYIITQFVLCSKTLPVIKLMVFYKIPLGI